ncbi:MAG: thermonuclease family protein, partial [Candidatus Parcubacteria bacterium]|nr:thermonuclease family protein [Leptolyngbyaceae cyanobacterium LF-bin-113]
MRFITSIALFALSAAILAFQLPAQADMTAKVVSIGDGDTLTVQQSSRKVTIRLSCIDAPERAQAPWGAESTAKLKGLLPIGQQVRIRKVEKGVSVVMEPDFALRVFQ